MQGVRVCIMWGCPHSHHVNTKVTDNIHRYILRSLVFAEVHDGYI